MTAAGIAALWLLPGALLVRSIFGHSWLTAASLGPSVSVLLLSFAGALFGLLGLPATLLSAVAVVGLGLGGAALVFRTRVRSPAFSRGDGDGWVLLGAGLGALLGAVVWGLPSTWLTRPQQFPEDPLWHQYVVSTIGRRGLMGPQNLVPVDGFEETIHVYQHGAHLAAGLVVGEGVTAVAAALNLTLWLAVVVLLPLGAATLTWTLSGDRVAVLLAPALVVLAPNGVFSFTSLFAFTVGLSLLPSVVLAGLLHARRLSFMTGSLLTAVLTGVLLIHVHAFLAAALLLVFLWVAEQLRAAPGAAGTADRSVGGDWVHSAAMMSLPALAVLLLASPWLLLARGIFGSGLESAGFTVLHLREPGFPSAGAALSPLLAGRRLASEVGSARSLLGVAMPAAAAYLVWRRRHIGLATFVLIFTLMTAFVAGGSGRLRDVIATPWLGDWWRMAAILSIAGGIAIAIAVGDVTSRVRGAATRIPSRAIVNVLIVLALSSALIGRVAVAGDELLRPFAPLPPDEADDLAAESAPAGPPLMVLSPLEVQAMGYLDDITPAGTRVLNWWGDGSPWMYSAAGLVPTRIYPNASALLENVLLVDEVFGEPDGYDEAVEALAELRVCSAYTAAGHSFEDPPAWTELHDLPGFEIVYRNDHARVYRAVDPRLVANCTPS